MRKTSQDGDTTSITSGVENEIKKSSAGIIKSKRNSIKRKVQTLSHESDDAVIEPLLQKEKETPESVNQSAKFSVLKLKTDAVLEKDGDKDKLLPDSKVKSSGFQETSLSSSAKENIAFKTQPSTSAPLHNHMNTNVFSNIETTKFITSTKSQILVEIDGCKQVGYSPSPLIFTTAKIHTDTKTKQMEPVEVTTVPILSTTEIANAGKAANNISISQAVPSTSEVKVTEKLYKNLAVATLSSVTETSKKYVPNTTSENKIQNTLSVRGSVVSSSFTKDSTKPGVFATDIQVCKSMSNKIEPMASVSHTAGKVSQPLKKENLPKTSQPQSLPHTDVRSSSTVPVSKASLTTSDSILGAPGKSKTEDSVPKLDKATAVKKDTLLQQNGKIDENANNNVAIQQPVKHNVTEVKKSPIDVKIADTKEKVIKDSTSLSSSKLLPRQKNAIVEEAGDIISKTKPSYSESSSASNIPKLSKDTEGKMTAPPKHTVQSQVTERDVSDKTLPKSSANNIIDTMTTKITATSIVSKPTVSLSSTIKSPVVSKPQGIAVTTSTAPATKPSATKIPSIDTKTKTSVTPTLTSSTISNKSPTPSSATLPSTTPSTIYNKVSTISTIKSDTGGVSQSSALNKLNGASTSKPFSANSVSPLSIEKKTPSTSNGSNPVSIAVKPSTVKPVSTSSVTTTITTKPTSTTTQVAKPSASSKKNGPKTNEVNKDNKGLKT